MGMENLNRKRLHLCAGQMPTPPLQPLAPPSGAWEPHCLCCQQTYVIIYTGWTRDAQKVSVCLQLWFSGRDVRLLLDGAGGSGSASGKCGPGSGLAVCVMGCVCVCVWPSILSGCLCGVWPVRCECERDGGVCLAVCTCISGNCNCMFCIFVFV